jgi:hypothetical protein
LRCLTRCSWLHLKLHPKPIREGAVIRKVTLKAVALVGILFFLAQDALAGSVTHVGAFYCGDCGAFPGQGQPNTPDINVFIHSVVNQYVSSWVDSEGEAKTVAICDGSVCANFIYVKISGQFRQSSDEYPDQRSYRNSQPPPSSGGGGGFGDGGGVGGGTGDGSWCMYGGGGFACVTVAGEKYCFWYPEPRICF